MCKVFSTRIGDTGGHKDDTGGTGGHENKSFKGFS